MNMNNDLKFRGNDPGAVQFGNFINYYSFYPPNERISRLPEDIWIADSITQCLDIGCNTGDLTRAFSSFLVKCGSENHILAIDIDPVLIKRAKEQSTINIKFATVDIMSPDGLDFIQTYLSRLNLKKFKIVTCFSISMWIHLNHGDAGLTTFLELVSDLAELLVIEAQPWKCYRNAVRRMKKSNGTFPHFHSLRYRENVTEVIEEILIEKCKRTKIAETDDTQWGRKTLFFK